MVHKNQFDYIQDVTQNVELMCEIRWSEIIGKQFKQRNKLNTQ